jgi:large subunit ribosomal protein L13
MQRKTYTIDATNKVLGRLATRISLLLRGKNKPDFVLNKDMGDFVFIKNIEKIKITGNKMEQKKYYSHSGYPKGFKETSLKRLFKLSPEKVLVKAVYGMLPKNRLRAKAIKRLSFERPYKVYN